MAPKFLILAIILFAFSTSGYSGTLQQCKEVASVMSKDLPLNIDKSTVLNHIECFEKKLKPTIYFYYMVTSKPSSKKENNSVLNILHKTLLTGWCTTPDLRKVLNEFDIEPLYRTKNGEYIGEFNISSKMCSD